MFTHKSREQIIADAKKKTESMNEHHDRSRLFHEQETKRNNANYKFERYIRDVKNNEDKIAKSVLNVKQSYEEYEQVLTNFNLSNDSSLKEKMSAILSNNDSSAFHVRQITAFVEYLLHQHKHALDKNKQPKNNVKIF
jgi:hypothetical protein